MRVNQQQRGVRLLESTGMFHNMHVLYFVLRMSPYKRVVIHVLSILSSVTFQELIINKCSQKLSCSSNQQNWQRVAFTSNNVQQLKTLCRWFLSHSTNKQQIGSKLSSGCFRFVCMECILFFVFFLGLGVSQYQRARSGLMHRMLLHGRQMELVSK